MNGFSNGVKKIGIGVHDSYIGIIHIKTKRRLGYVIKK